jgi:hypothetical protein
MPTAVETQVEYHIHRDIWPHTDHGYTWVEFYWFEKDGQRISPISPCGGCTERLGHMPGGPVGDPETQARDMAYYAPKWASARENRENPPRAPSRGHR